MFIGNSKFSVNACYKLANSQIYLKKLMDIFLHKNGCVVGLHLITAHYCFKNSKAKVNFPMVPPCPFDN